MKGYRHYIRLVLVVVLGLIVTTVSIAPMSSGMESKNTNFVTSQKAIVNNTPKAFDAPYLEYIQRYSNEYGLDYRFIIALITQESQFNHESVSERGALGIMQIMPVTSSEIEEKLSIENPSLPEENIRAGVYYISSLYDLFKVGTREDRLSLALAAYNAGPSRVYDAQDIAAYMGENPNCWKTVKSVLPLLSKRYYSLHRSVWGVNRPRSGYFGESRQTVNYVENIMNNYQTLTQE